VTYCSDSNATYVVGIAQGVRADELDAPLPFVYSGNIAPCRITPEAQSKVHLFGEVVARRTGIRGLWQADFQVDKQEQLWLLEINPRWSASMELHEITQGFSWMHQHLRILDGFDVDLSHHRLCIQKGLEFDPAGPTVGKGIVYAPKTMEVAPAAIERLWQARWQGGLEELQIHPFRVADIPRFQEPAMQASNIVFPEGIPIATVFCCATRSGDSIAGLRQAKQIVLEWLEKS
jgi:predicted ATP-grasp superfamily ATP-dependent carboligase